jgi:lysophospholipase L1-like esterase
MGGPGAAYAWARTSSPLMGGDLIHLTPAGYRRSAALLARHLGWAP